MIEILLGSLYDLVLEESKKLPHGMDSKKGHEFEDATANQIVQKAGDLGLKPNPPRYTPRLPALSGNQYEYDASFDYNGVTYLVECKRRMTANREHLYYLGARMLDHIFGARLKGQELRVRGIFMTTSDVGESAWLYALGYGITIIEPSSPPVEWVLQALPQGSVLRKPIQKLIEDLRDLSDVLSKHGRKSTKELLKDYRYLSKRGLEEIRGAKKDEVFSST